MANIASELATRGRILVALLLREAMRRGDGWTGYVGLVLEPLAFVIGLSIIRYELHPVPPLGPSMVLFFLNGVVVFYAFNKCESFVSASLHKSRNLLAYPVISPYDIYFCQLVFVTINMLLLYHILLFGHNFFMKNWLPNQILWPEDILRVYMAILSASIYGFFLGVMNAAIEVYWEKWDSIWSWVRRAQLLFSGKMFVVDFAPPNVREVMYYNPLMHAIELARSGFYPYYESHTMDMGFFWKTLVVIALFAVALDAKARERLEVES